jgi:nitric oxide reductase subunit B
MHPGRPWKEGLVEFAFWAIDTGLMTMVLISLLPVGLMQTWRATCTRAAPKSCKMA